LRILGVLPLPVVHVFGALAGRILWMMHGRARRIAERNLSLVLTQNDAETRQ
jgi:KDO2-lipid IV(A) lauroyltransferase